MLRIMDRNAVIGRLVPQRLGPARRARPRDARASSVFRDGAFQPYQPQAVGPAQGGLVGRLVSRLARPPGVRRDRAPEPAERPTRRARTHRIETDCHARSSTTLLTLLGLIVVASPAAAGGRPRALVAAGPDARRGARRPSWSTRRSSSGLLAAVAVLALDADRRARGTSRSTWATGSSIPRPLPLLGQVRLRPAVGAVRDPVVRPVRARSGRSPPGTCTASRATTASSSSTRSSCWAWWSTVAGGHHRDAVHRLGAGRAVVGAAGGVLPGAAGAGAERPAGSGSSTASPTPPCCWPPWCCTTCAARATSTSCWATGPWPVRALVASPRARRCVVGLLLLVAAAGKSALVPFSGWLPRAMEGPTPSSAVFYGALSVHLGAFLLLRVSPLLDLSPLLCGGDRRARPATAVFALPGRQRADRHQVGACRSPR